MYSQFALSSHDAAPLTLCFLVQHFDLALHPHMPVGSSMHPCPPIPFCLKTGMSLCILLPFQSHDHAKMLLLQFVDIYGTCLLQCLQTLRPYFQLALCIYIARHKAWLAQLQHEEHPKA